MEKTYVGRPARIDFQSFRDPVAPINHVFVVFPKFQQTLVHFLFFYRITGNFLKRIRSVIDDYQRRVIIGVVVIRELFFSFAKHPFRTSLAVAPSLSHYRVP